MKVPVFTDVKNIEFQDRSKPRPGRGEAVVKVSFCGICGSDVHGFLNAIMVAPGTVMGHECSGIVEELGSGDFHVIPGERVTVKPIAQCGACYWCLRGQYSLCPKALERAIGISPAHDGAFAQYVLIKYPSEMLVELPDSVTLEQGALVEPLATSLHGVRLSRFKPGDTAVVIGAGMIGLGVVQFLQLGGAGKIIVLEINRKKSAIAATLGADTVLNPENAGSDVMEKIMALTGGVGADIVFECAGVPLALQTCTDYVKSGGQVMLIGINDREVAIQPFMMVVREVELKGVIGYYDEFSYVLDFLARRKVNTDVLISDSIDLHDIEEQGFKRLLAPNNLVKVLVKP